jgi:hypothetical protein
VLHLLVSQSIEDEQSLTAIRHDAGISQYGQLLGHIGLRAAEYRLQVADARLAPPQFVKNPQSGLVREQAEQVRGLLMSSLHSRCIPYYMQ